VTAGYLLKLYRMRRSNWEDGSSRYPKRLYEDVCRFVDQLEKLEPDMACRLEHVVDSNGEVAVFFAGTREIGRLRSDPEP
jgi:hypothetical protein